MKRVLYAIAFACMATACTGPKQVSDKRIIEHTSQVGCLWTEPIDLPNFEPGKANLMEAHLPDGTQILVFCRDTTLLGELRDAYWVKNNVSGGAKIRGYSFTIDDLKGESFTDEETIKKSQQFNDKQKDMLIRYRLHRKYEMLSYLGPITGTARYVNNAYVPVLDGIGARVQTQQAAPDYQPRRSTPTTPPRKPGRYY